MRIRLIALSLLFVVAAVAGVWTRQAGPAQLALEAAKKTEVVDRNLLAAIAQYRDVAARYESDTTVAPTALLQLAGCYEQLHQPEARATYERILKYYPNSAPAKAARVKLEGQREVGLSTTQLANWALGGAPSPDGRYMTGMDPETGDLAVRDLKSGRTRRVTAIGKKESLSDFPSAVNSVPSPDGRQIAFGWRPSDRWELHVINYDGSQERVLCCREILGDGPPSLAVVDVFGWSGDGKQILFSLSSRRPDSGSTIELMTVPAIGGTPRVLKRFRGDEGSIGGAGWSPDGRFIVYDHRGVSGKLTDHDLFVMRADGSNTETFVTNDANDRMLQWFPDGKRVLFLSDRQGLGSVFSQSVADGKAVGDPTLVKSLVGIFNGQGFTRDGAYYYNEFSVIRDVLTARLDASGAVSGKVDPLPSRSAGGKADAVWSPDGSKIAYLHVTPGWPVVIDSLAIQVVSTGEVHAVPAKFKQMWSPAWMPDGRAIIVGGTDLDGRRGLFRIELSDGAASTIGELTPGSDPLHKNLPAVSSNGREVFYTLTDNANSSKGIQARDLASGALRTVFEGPIMNFALSPDGRFIAIASPDREQGADQTPPFRIIPVAGGQSRAIGTELAREYHETGFAWSADGRYLLFARFARAVAGRRMALWRVPVDGGPAQPTDIYPPNNLLRISVRPDGLLAMSTHTNHFEFWVMRNIPPAAKR